MERIWPATAESSPCQSLCFLLEEYYRLHPNLRDRETLTLFLDESQLIQGWESFVRRAQGATERDRRPLLQSYVDVAVLRDVIDREVRALKEAHQQHPLARPRLLLLDSLPAPASPPPPVEIVPMLPWFLEAPETP